MIRDLLVVDISRLGDPFIAPVCQDLLRKRLRQLVVSQPADILVDLLGDCARQNARVRSGISRQLLLIQFLHDAERLVRADLEKSGTVILKLRQIVEQRRILCFLLLLDLFKDRWLYRFFLEKCYEIIGILLFQKTVVFIQKRRLVIVRTFHCLPLKAALMAADIADRSYLIKRDLHKFPYLPFAVHDHSQHTGHHTADGDDRPVCLQVGLDRCAVLESQRSGKIDSHQIIFFGAQIGGVGKIVICREILCLADPTQDLLLRLGVDPHALARFALYLRLLFHQTVYVFSLAPGVCADINCLHILPVQKTAYDLKLLFDAADHLVLELLRDKRDRVKRPSLILFIVGFRIAHRDKMTDAPSNNGLLGFHIAVVVSHMIF